MSIKVPEINPIIVEIVWFGNLSNIYFKKFENMTNPNKEPKVKKLIITKNLLV